MLIFAAICFSLAALLGLVLITYVLQNKNTPKGIAIIHGFFAALGIVILAIYSFTHKMDAIISLLLFFIAALGGFTLIYRDLTGKTLPKWLAIGHGLVAISAFITLICYIFFNYV